MCEYYSIVVLLQGAGSLSLPSSSSSSSGTRGILVLGAVEGEREREGGRG